MSISLTSSTAASTFPSSGSLVGGSRSVALVSGGALPLSVSTSAALFREIHKNTWLKRLTADGKKVTVGPKKSERSWVVFCVHDDSQALLEGYAEPRQAGSHNPEWMVSMQETQHISHALIPNSHEFEFVVTLSNEVVRFHAMSWEVMQEWVETLRSKLREMKILSPRENLYTKLPEIRAPLLPTRDPTSPLPAPPPVPAALVPGVERVVPQSVLHVDDTVHTIANDLDVSGAQSGYLAATLNLNASPSDAVELIPTLMTPSPQAASNAHLHTSPILTSMSNTLTQNLLNMLSDPITAYSEQLYEDDLATEVNMEDKDAMTNIGLEFLNSLEELSTHSMHGVMSVGKSEDQKGASLSSTKSHDLLNETENSVRLDIGNTNRVSFVSEHSRTLENLMECERLIPRPQTSRSLSAGAADAAVHTRRQLAGVATIQQQVTSKTKTSPNSNNNITELEISSDPELQSTSVVTSTTAATDPTTNITIIQVTNINEKQLSKYFNNINTNLNNTADIFKFPEETENIQHEEYKSNVQIIPSNLNSSTIQVMGQNVTAVANQYSTPVKKNVHQHASNVEALSNSSVTSVISLPRSHLENHKITTVHVGDITAPAPSSIYGTCYNCTETSASSPMTTHPKTIIMSANTSGITNITVNNSQVATTSESIAKSDIFENNVKHNVGNARYEKVFLSSSIPVATQDKNRTSTASLNNSFSTSNVLKSPKLSTQLHPLHQHAENTSTNKFDRLNSIVATSPSLPGSPTPVTASEAFYNTKKQKPTTSLQAASTSVIRNNSKHSHVASPLTASMTADGSPAMSRKRVVSTSPSSAVTDTPLVPTRSKFLTRGLTEAVITARPSRKDIYFTKTTAYPKVENSSSNATSCNNNFDEPTTSASCSSEASSQAHTVIFRSESLEQRRRSSSTSEAHTHRPRATNNNEFPPNRGVASAMRIQQPPYPLRSMENGSQCGVTSPPAASPVAKRITLREQQVMQLRREIMHPGGVRLQLRRKDCVGSIAWVDAFGAIWVAGWKQKEHPVLYNALHIGDQLISIAGVSMSSAAEANKIIRNTNTLFVEVLIRRIPLGRGYAIRREREGQCLGLIRDGNSSTIVDVVPNSLAARHGLPPKAQSCDGSTLTFWVLTEINGRPLNLFFKENEIRDRLNSVGRDISILVQPSDLITKLKKQLKSLRGYKDYLVQ